MRRVRRGLEDEASSVPRTGQEVPNSRERMHGVGHREKEREGGKERRTVQEPKKKLVSERTMLEAGKMNERTKVDGAGEASE